MILLTILFAGYVALMYLVVRYEAALMHIDHYNGDSPDAKEQSEIAYRARHLFSGRAKGG